MQPNQDIVSLLETTATKMNQPDFIESDPVKFPRLFSDIRDIEIVSLLVSAIAWGNRKMILRNADRMLTLMEHSPYHYIMDGGYEELENGQNIHRTFFTDNLKHFLRGLHKIYSKYDTIDSMIKKLAVNREEYVPWRLAEIINTELREANAGYADSRCLPVDTSKSALKRLNMAMRWLVRDDGIVDLGVWSSLKPSQLFIPLDVHVGDVSRGLGLLERRSNDRKAVIELTECLRTLRPEDPTFYDFALFGIGVTGEKSNLFC